MTGKEIGKLKNDRLLWVAVIVLSLVWLAMNVFVYGGASILSVGLPLVVIACGISGIAHINRRLGQ